MAVIDSPTDIQRASGKLGILMPGLGAVSTTFIAGTIAIRKGISEPIGSLTQMGSLRLGKRNENREVNINDFVPLASLDDLVFGGWDIFEDNCYEAAVKAGVIDVSLLDQIKSELSSIKPMKAVFDKKFVKKYSLNFPLLSDESKKMLQAYGVWKEKSLYGRKFMGIERTTFILDENGKIDDIFHKVKVDGHLEEVLGKLD